MGISNNQNCNTLTLKGVVLNEPSIEIVEVNKKNILKIQREYFDGRCRDVNLYLNDTYIMAFDGIGYKCTIASVEVRTTSILVKMEDSEGCLAFQVQLWLREVKAWRE